jgi:O-methyltransferase
MFVISKVRSSIPLKSRQSFKSMNHIELPRDLYINLLKSILCNSIYCDAELEEVKLAPWKQRVIDALAGKQVAVGIWKTYDEQKRVSGLDWPSVAHTMIGLKRLNNLQACVETVLKESVPGDLIETGVWRGGAAIFMRGILKAWSVTDRKVWVADSFEGLPPPDVEAFPQDAGDVHHTLDFLKVSLERVKENFANYSLLDDQVIFLKGWFKDTLPSARIENLAVLRLDGDMYESTISVLNNLYGKVSPGGFIIIDDFCIPNCAEAVHDYRKKHAVKEPIIDIDGTGVYWRKN